MSDSIIVSVCNFPVVQTIPGVLPGEYIVEAAAPGEFTITVVKEASNPTYIDEDRGTLHRTLPSKQIADSIIFDFVTSQLGIGEDCAPGMFAVEGVFTPEQVRTKLASELARVKRMHANWAKRLVEIANDEWEKNHQYQHVSDIHRRAAVYLEMKPEWLSVTAHKDTQQKCRVCKSEIDAQALICPVCKVHLKPDQLAKEKFVGAN